MSFLHVSLVSVILTIIRVILPTQVLVVFLFLFLFLFAVLGLQAIVIVEVCQRLYLCLVPLLLESVLDVLRT